MADPMQQARELLADSYEKLGEFTCAAMTRSGRHEHRAALEAIAALLAALADLAERHAATERDACRLARIAEEQRDGRLAALERVAELEAKLRAAPEGLIEQHARDSQELRRLCQSRDFYKQRCEALQAVQPNMRDPERKAVCDILANGSTSALATRPQGVKDAT